MRDVSGVASGMTRHKDSDDNDIQLSFLPPPTPAFTSVFIPENGLSSHGGMDHEQDVVTGLVPLVTPKRKRMASSEHLCLTF